MSICTYSLFTFLLSGLSFSTIILIIASQKALFVLGERGHFFWFVF